MSLTAAQIPAVAGAEDPSAPLDARIEQLLKEIDQAQTTVSDILREEDKALHPTADKGTAPAEPAQPIDPGLEESIDQAIAEAQKATHEESAKIAADQAPAAPAGSVEQIDETLAREADDKMAGVESTPAASDAGSTSGEAPPPAPVGEVGETLGSGSSAESSGAAQVVPVVVSAPPEPLEAQTPDQPPDEPEAKESGRIKVFAGSGILVRAAAWPLSLVPVMIRDMVGWFAIVTLFNAACLWLFLLL